MKLLLTSDVPRGRQDDDAAVLERGQVVLGAAIAEGVLDAVFPREALEVGLGDVEPLALGLPAKRKATRVEGHS